MVVVIVNKKEPVPTPKGIFNSWAQQLDPVGGIFVKARVR